MYLTESHITAYEVTRGSITGNYRFHAFSLRDETVVNATQSGTVRYYMREGRRPLQGAWSALSMSRGRQLRSATAHFP